MVSIIKGDLLQCTEEIFGHQVNCQGVMGSGIARQIRDRYPIVYEEYIRYCEGKSPEELLGQCQLVETDQKTVANLFGQLNYGREPVLYTNYEGLRRSLQSLKNYAQQNGKQVALPYLIGCGLANGDWSIVSRMIEEVFENYEVTLYQFGN